jgi:cbb3-type cytochrome oxidase maturation protein
MDVIYGLIPAMILSGLISVLVFFWAVKNGQYEDMEGPAHRILDDDDMKVSGPKPQKKDPDNGKKD